MAQWLVNAGNYIWDDPTTNLCSNYRIQTNNLRPFQQTPGAYPKPPANSLCFGIPFIWGFGDVWGMLQGYVGIPLEIKLAKPVLQNYKVGWVFEGKLPLFLLGNGQMAQIRSYTPEN